MQNFTCSQCGKRMRQPALTRNTYVAGTANSRVARVSHLCTDCERSEMAQRIAGARAAAEQTLREGGFDEATIAMLMAS